MKYIVILCDGMADEPLESLSGKTPLEAAKTLNMDRLAKNAEIGMVQTVPKLSLIHISEPTRRRASSGKRYCKPVGDRI